jgi:pimeloyl-ACP methyl ester carboxylesterase
MLLMPFSLLILVALGLVALGLLGGGLYLVWAWWVGAVVGTAYLVAGLAMTALSLAGRWLVLLLRPPGRDEPREERGGEVHRLARPGGGELQVEVYGPPDAPPIVLTHGSGTAGAVWHDAKRDLAGRYRLIVWDLPGLGLSREPADRDHALEALARDLEAVLALAGGRPALLLGHSLGGMATLTFCRLFPQHLGRAVAGLALINTTYTNPVRTTTGRRFFTAAERPLLRPLLHLIIWTAPLAWLGNWLSYLNGSLHLLNLLTGFAGGETRGRLEFATRFSARAWPAVVAREALAMFDYDATATLGALHLPVLIIAGDTDRQTIPEASARMRDSLPAAELVVLAPAGHMSFLERPAAWAEAVGAFAARVLGAATPRAAGR